MSSGPPGFVMTAQDIANYYNAAMDSVTLINQILAGDHDGRMSPTAKADALRRNVEHLAIVLEKDWWTTEDLQPFRDAIAAANA